jgi:hypothetical protein
MHPNFNSGVMNFSFLFFNHQNTCIGTSSFVTMIRVVILCIQKKQLGTSSSFSPSQNTTGVLSTAVETCDSCIFLVSSPTIRDRPGSTTSSLSCIVRGLELEESAEGIRPDAVIEDSVSPPLSCPCTPLSGVEGAACSAAFNDERPVPTVLLLLLLLETIMWLAAVDEALTSLAWEGAWREMDAPELANEAGCCLDDTVCS